MPNAQTPARKRKPRTKTALLGREIYRRDILPLVKDDHFGEYVAIDVPTGEWEIAESTRIAVDRLRERCPDAIDILCERVGYRAVVSFGGAVLETSE